LEKPTKEGDKNLSAAGEYRASQLPAYFNKSFPLAKDHVFATHESKNSNRPVLTITPTATKLDLKVHHKIKNKKFKELAKELKPLLTSVQSSPQSYQIWPKVEDLVAKEREMQEKLMARHSTVVDSFEKKLRGQDIENRIASQQQKIAVLRQEVEYLLEYLSEI